MTNEISKRNETLPSTETTNSYLAYAESVAPSRIVGKLLKFTKFGEFVAGEEGEEVPMGTELIVHGEEMWIGWIKWEDGRPVDTRMGRMVDGFVPAERAELGDTDESKWEVDDQGKPRPPWQKSAYTVMYDAKADQVYTFACSSKGGHTANGKTAKAYYQRSRMTPDMFPVISLNWDKYKHRDRSRGEIAVPIFDIVGWTHRGKIDDALRAAVGEATAQAEADQAGADYYNNDSAAKLPPVNPVPQQTEQTKYRQAVGQDAVPQRREATSLNLKPGELQPQTLSAAARKPRF